MTHNGKTQGTSQVSPSTSDLTRLFDLKTSLIEGSNKVSITFSGSGALAYQVVGVYYLPHGTAAGKGPLTFSLKYDKTALKVNETVAVTATVGNTGSGTIPAVMMRVGLPPGFTVKLSDLSHSKTNGVVNMVEQKSPYLVLYLGNLDGGKSEAVTFNMTATLAVKAKAPASEAYPYYTPEYLQLAEAPLVTVTH